MMRSGAFCPQNRPRRGFPHVGKLLRINPRIENVDGSQDNVLFALGSIRIIARLGHVDGTQEVRGLLPCMRHPCRLYHAVDWKTNEQKHTLKVSAVTHPQFLLLRDITHR